MLRRSQTAIRAVAWTSVANIAARLLGLGSHVAITAFFGLSGELDAYFVALSLVTLTFLVFGDGFDSIGVGPLVSALRQSGESRFRDLAGALLVLAAATSFALAVVVAALLPWAHYLAPGLDEEVVPLVAGNLVRLGAFALLQLPCRAAASILRARRQFLAASAWEVVSAAGTLAALVALRHSPFAASLGLSAGAIAGALVLGALTGTTPRFSRALARDVGTLGRALAALLPIYGVDQLFRIADRVFASFLPQGAISAISYGQMIVLVPGSILALHNIFMTPLAESVHRAPLVRRIVDGILILSLPMTVFAVVFSDVTVAAAFERGRFDAAATHMTAQAFRGFALGLPAVFAWPVLYRVFQVLDRTSTVVWLSLGTLALNCALNGLSLALGLGVTGLALATTMATYTLVAAGLVTLGGQIGRLVSPNAVGVALYSASASGLALAVALALPSPASALARFALDGTVFVFVAGALMAVAPAQGIREWRATVLADLRGRQESAP